MVKRYFHGDTIEGFLAMPEAQIVGNLTTAHTSLHSSLQGLQADAWHEEIVLLKSILSPYIGRGHIFFEYTIPRMGRRIDVVLLLDGVVLLLEFKAFNEQYTKADIAQVWDYALDLKNFHEQSHNRPIVPILVATEAIDTTSELDSEDKIRSFELFRRNLHNPEIITYDEFLARAKFAVKYDDCIEEIAPEHSFDINDLPY